MQRIISADSPLPGIASAGLGFAALMVTQAGDNPISSSVLALLGTFLGATGIGGVAARQMMIEYSRRQEALRKERAEEREQDRTDHQAWVTRFEHIMAAERDQRERERTYLLSQIEVWRLRCDAIDERHNKFVVQFIERQVNNTNTSGPPS